MYETLTTEKTVDEFDVFDWKAVIRERQSILEDMTGSAAGKLDDVLQHTEDLQLHERVASVLRRTIDELEELGIHPGGTSFDE